MFPILLDALDARLTSSVLAETAYE
jgi:hypothetical protein